MIRHPAPFRLKPGATSEDLRVVEWMRRLEALPAEMPATVDREQGWNVTDRPIAYDFGLNSSFRTREGTRRLPSASRPSGDGRGRESSSDRVIRDYEHQT